MTHEEYRKKRLERKMRRANHRYGWIDGMGVRLSNPSADSFRYPHVKSAKRFIKFADGVKCLTFRYETFAVSGYGCKKVECVHREEPTILERCCDKICWKER